MHHTTIWQTLKKKLILCHVTSDMPVTLVTPGKPRKFKIQVQSSKSCVAVWGLIKALHDTGRAQWPIFISTSGTLTNKTSFCLSSSNSLLGLIHVVTYSHNSIFRTRSWSTET